MIHQFLAQIGESGRVFLGAVVGILVGYIMKDDGLDDDVQSRLVGLFGNLWLRSLKVIVLPLIFCNMLSTCNSLKNIPGAGAIGKMTLLFYSATTVTAALIGLGVVSFIIIPSVSVLPDASLPDAITNDFQVTNATVEHRDVIDQFESILFGIFPTNIVAAAVGNNLVGIISFGSILGLVLDEGSPFVVIVNDLNTALFHIIQMVIELTPFGVCSLIAPKIAKLDASTVGVDLGIFLVAISTGLCFHCFIIYPLLYFFLTQKNPLPFFRGIMPAMATALGTSSSAATLPVTLSCVTQLGVHPTIAKFVLSLGATCNMDGTAIGFPTAVVWLACTQGIQMSFDRLLMTCVVSTLASMGAAPIPSAGLVLLVMIMDSVNVPFTAAFGLIVAVDWLYDRLETMVNITGDSFAAAIIQHYVPQEILNPTEFDIEAFYDRTETQGVELMLSTKFGRRKTEEDRAAAQR